MTRGATYEYACGTCGESAEKVRLRKRRNKPLKCSCGGVMTREFSKPRLPHQRPTARQPAAPSVPRRGSTGISIAPGVRGTRSIGNTFRNLDVGIDVGSGATLDSDGDKFHGNRDAIRWQDADVSARDTTID